MSGNYLVEHSAGSIIRGAFQIYFRHFSTLFLIYVLPVMPVAVLQGEAEMTGKTSLIVLSALLTLTVSYFAFGAVTVAVSDICLGNQPSIKRSYARILGKLVLLLLLTNLLQILAVAIGFVLLVVPGLVLFLWLILSPSVVVLEGRSGVAALKRSKQLGDGSHWRNAGLLLLLAVMMFVIGGVVGGVFGALFPDLVNHWIFRTLLTTFQVGLATPITLIAFVLIYYDRRVRKENYNARALAEDLAR